MLLAVLTYPYLFKQLLVISDPTARTEYPEQKEIKTGVTFISPKSRDMIRTSTTLTPYAGGMLVTETKKDTVYGDGHSTARPVIMVSRRLGTGDYWKVTAILFIMVLYVTMVCGPMAAKGIFGGVTPFIGLLLTTLYTGDKLAGLWYPVAGAAVCLIIVALFLPNKGPKFAS